MADVITRLKVESSEYDAKLKRAAQGLQHMEDACRKIGGSLLILDKEEKAFIQSLGQMETVSKTARGRLGELTTVFTNLRAQYNRLTQEEKSGDYGRALNSSLEQLKVRIKDAKTELAGIQQELSDSKFGQFGSIIDGIGQKMGVNANLTELLTSKTAIMSAGIGASVAIIGKATEEWAKYNTELAKQDQITTVTTGMKGPDADRMTDQARALVDTYGVDFREAINAVNTLMTQFGKSGEESMDLIRQGMQGMIQGDGPKLLSMIQQYAPSFRDAGIEASQLVAIIQNSEGGIFTDQNMNAIVMGIKNIRLMTKATSDALAQLGIDGQKMSKDLSDGTITIFDAMKQVVDQLQKVESGGKTAGEVMQQVFGRQGTAAGTNLAKAIATLNTNLEETKRQTGEVGQSYDDLYDANVKLNQAIRACFEYDGWEQMSNGIKAKLVTALADVLDLTAKVKDSWVGDVGRTIFDTMTDAALKASGPLGTVLSLLRNINKEKDSNGGNNGGVGYSDVDKTLQYIGSGATQQERSTRYDKAIAQLRQKLDNVGKERRVNNADGSVSFKTDPQEVQDQKRAALERRISILEQRRESVVNRPSASPVEPVKPIEPALQGGGRGGGRSTTKEEKDDFTEIIGLIPNAEEAVKSLQQQIRESWDEGEIASLTKDLQRAEDELNRLKNIGKEVKPAEMTTGLSGMNSTAIGAYTGMVSGTLSNMDYGSPDYTATFANMIDAQTFGNVLQTAIQQGVDIAATDIDVEGLWDSIVGGENIPDEVWQSLQDKINEQLEAMQIAPIKIDFQTGGVRQEANKMNDDWKQAASAIQSVGAAMMSIEDPAAKVMGTIAQAIASIALGAGQAIAQASNGSAGGPWGWIAFAAAATATMISTIASVKSATAGSYEQGGIVPGNSWHGDNLTANVNSGELILTRAQQNNLASQLQGGGIGNMNLSATIKGEDIRLVLNNNSRRRGKGEYVTTTLTR